MQLLVCTLMGVFHRSEENMLPMSLLLSVLAGAAGSAAAGASGSAAGLEKLKPLHLGAALCSDKQPRHTTAHHSTHHSR